VDARRVREWDIGFFPYRRFGESISAGTEEMYELEILGLFGCGELEQGDENSSIF